MLTISVFNPVTGEWELPIDIPIDTHTEAFSAYLDTLVSPEFTASEDGDPAISHLPTLIDEGKA